MPRNAIRMIRSYIGDTHLSPPPFRQAQVSSSAGAGLPLNPTKTVTARTFVLPLWPIRGMDCFAPRAAPERLPSTPRSFRQARYRTVRTAPEHLGTEGFAVDE